jgi:lipopolysaccharide transport system ATP-binding protein
MSEQVALSFEKVSKRFNRQGSGAATVHAALVSPRRLRRNRRDFWALRDVDLTVGVAETVGVVGANGSGKTTLLRLAGGLGKPTRGRITRTRTVAAMLTLGEGFDPLLTGRENAVTAGILTGYTRKQAQRKIEEIVAFAELEQFIDDPLRTYSSGMIVRLAFAAAISAEPELLLVDEVLTVGDLSFQRKCLDRLDELRRHGTTILFASHDEGQVRAVCNRVVWLAHGRIEVDGTAEEAFHAYRSAARVEAERRAELLPPHLAARRDEVGVGEHRFGTLEVEIAEVRVSPAHVRNGRVDAAHPVSIELVLVPHTAVDEPIVGVSLSRVRDGESDAEAIDVNTSSDNVRLGRLDRPTRVVLSLDRLDVRPGRYHVNVGIFERSWSHVYDYHWQLHLIEVTGAAGESFGPPRRWSIA